VSGFLRIAVVLVVAATAALAANFVLLGVATRGDAVGHLSPRGTPARALPTVVQVTPPAPRGEDNRRSDD
jgi:hypothetical protein